MLSGNPFIQPGARKGNARPAHRLHSVDDDYIIFIVIVVDAGFTNPGRAAPLEVLGFELLVTPIDDPCPSPEWKDECGRAGASEASFHIDGNGAGVFSEQWPGGTAEGDSASRAETTARLALRRRLRRISGFRTLHRLVQLSADLSCSDQRVSY